MEWQDEGFVLASRPHGEAASIVSLLTSQNGRFSGLVHGGQSRRQRAVLQVGNKVTAVWRARLDEHLGTYSIELDSSTIAWLLGEPGKLLALSSASELVEAVIPERDPCPNLYQSFSALLGSFNGEYWAATYVYWELHLLTDIGFGLDLSECAGTGVTEDLVFVSPKSGKAVSRQAGEPYKDKLLKLPAFLKGASGAQISGKDLADGLILTGYFLQKCVFQPRQKKLPDSRVRLAAKLSSNN
tara:strand:+ start:896 stop:1621 length:726 start_codon:yes stop_codon:yes gene_type:complete